MTAVAGQLSLFELDADLEEGEATKLPGPPATRRSPRCSGPNRLDGR
jgi:hypothetical protein